MGTKLPRVSLVQSVNVGRPDGNPWKRGKRTGIGKRRTEDAVRVRAPGPKQAGLGSGLVGDFIGDERHHGGDGQAVYAFQREDLDHWEARLGRTLPTGSSARTSPPPGSTSTGPAGGALADRRRDVVLQVTGPRIPCADLPRLDRPARLGQAVHPGRPPGRYLCVVRAGDDPRG